jgi:mannitol/fructose-specific phosphotransferase system IIA component (Ntr-type)
MKISNLLDTQSILIDLRADTKESLISTLVNKLKGRIAADLLPTIRDAVLDREQVMSTGVGKSLAIPHAKIPELEENYAVFARLKTPIEYGSIDNQPVEIVFLLVGGQEKASVHIKLLSKISRLMNNDFFRNQLLVAKTPDEVMNIFLEEEGSAV